MPKSGNNSNVHRIENYSATKGKKPLTCAVMWMDFKSVMLRESSQTQKTTCDMIVYDGTGEKAKL